MKYVLLLCIVTMMACAEPGQTIKDFIPGTYARFSEGAYSRAWDTLRISAYDAEQNTYVIQQHVGFQRIIEDKLQPKAYKSAKWLVVFDPSTEQLQDMKSGKWFTFSPERGTVVTGHAEYYKLK